MAQITKQELLKIAQSSAVKVYDSEVEILVKQLDAVLTYAVRVKNIAQDVGEMDIDKKVNVVREDLVSATLAQPILVQAPEQEKNYFIVPMIIER